MINHHESLVQAEAMVGKGDRWEGCTHQDHAECELWKGVGTEQAGAWRANLFLPQHLTPFLLCHPPSHGCQCFCCLCCLSVGKGFPPQTPELCLCQDRSSSAALRAQLSLNTFNLPWHPQGIGKKNCCFVCGCKAPSTTMETLFNLMALQITTLCTLSHTTAL